MTTNELKEALISAKPVRARIRVSVHKEVMTFDRVDKILYSRDKSGNIEVSAQLVKGNSSVVVHPKAIIGLVERFDEKSLDKNFIVSPERIAAERPKFEGIAIRELCERYTAELNKYYTDHTDLTGVRESRAVRLATMQQILKENIDAIREE